MSTAETVCAGEEVQRRQVLDLLALLISKSLLASQTLQPGEARYSLLETIRQYAHEKLVSSGEIVVIRDRHLQCFVKLTEEVLPKLSSTYQRVWLNWLDGEFDNIRAALNWALESAQIEAGLRIAIAIYQFWTIRDYAEEGLVWMGRLLSDESGQVSPNIHANALAYAVFLAGFRGNSAAQAVYGQRAAALRLSLDPENKPALKWALTAQAYGAQVVGDYETQFNIMKQVIQINRELGDKYQLGLTLSVNSFTAMMLGQLEEAQSMLQEALPILREVGNPYRIAMALNFFGDLARCKQNYTDALVFYDESISLLRKLNAPRDLASALQNLGFTSLHMGKIERAHDLFGESLVLQVAQQNIPGLSECMMGIAATAVEAGLPATGACLLAAAVNIGGQRVISAWPATHLEYEHYLVRIRARLTESEYLSEQMNGQLLSMRQAVEYAQKLTIKPVTPIEVNQRVDILSSREREIALLIAQGKSNGEIAARLVLSKRTVEKHVAHIFLKLGLINRAQIVRWAIDNGLLPSINKSQTL